LGVEERANSVNDQTPPRTKLPLRVPETQSAFHPRAL
jgi:hypothetical protein